MVQRNGSRLRLGPGFRTTVVVVLGVVLQEHILVKIRHLSRVGSGRFGVTGHQAEITSLTGNAGSQYPEPAPAIPDAAPRCW